MISCVREGDREWTIHRTMQDMTPLHDHFKLKYDGSDLSIALLQQQQQEGEEAEAVMVDEDEAMQETADSTAEQRRRMRSGTIVKHGAANHKRHHKTQTMTVVESRSERIMVNLFLHALQVHHDSPDFDDEDRRLVQRFLNDPDPRLHSDNVPYVVNGDRGVHSVGNDAADRSSNGKSVSSVQTPKRSLCRMEGRVYKLGKRQWSRRYAMVRSGNMYYTARGGGTNGSGIKRVGSGNNTGGGSGGGSGNSMRCIPLCDVYRVQCQDGSGKNPFVFELVAHGETLRFSVDSEEERARWINAIIEEMIQRQTSSLHDSMGMMFENNFDRSREMLAAHVFDTLMMTYFDGNIAAMQQCFADFCESAERSDDDLRTEGSPPHTLNLNRRIAHVTENNEKQ